MSASSNLTDPRRRRLLAGGASALTASLLPTFSIGAPRAKKLTLVSWGGAYREAVEKAVVQPFTRDTGISVTLVDTPDLAKLRAQIQTQNVQWDVFDAPNALGVAGVNAGFWEPLDLAMFDRSDLVVDIMNNLVPWYLFVGGVAWDPKRRAGREVPRDFVEYFDAQRFPGRRTFRNRPSETLEAALLADGVDARNLYPLDVERAFKALDRIKPSVVKWVEQTPQSLTLLQTGEADFSYTYASRVKPAQASGVSVDFSFDQTIAGFEYLAVVKNAPHRDEAMQFVAYAAQPQCQAAFMTLLGNAPGSRKARALLDPATLKWIPDLESSQVLMMRDDWWTRHYDELSLRFKEWTLS